MEERKGKTWRGLRIGTKGEEVEKGRELRRDRKGVEQR